MLMEIKVIIFDLGGVIIEYDFSRFLKELFEPNPFDKPDSNLILEFWQQSDVYHQGKISDEEFFHQVCDLIKTCDLNQKEFFSSFNSVISKFNENIIKLIKEIKYNKKYKILLLSNINRSHWDCLLDKKWNFIQYFDEIILSHEIHLTKPDPKIFQHAIEKAGCNPEEILYIDDSIKNIQVAQELSLNSILYDNYEDLIWEFRNLRILLH